MRSGNSSSGRLAQASIAETWDRIKQGMDACFFEKSMKRAPWMELQTQVYNLAVDMSTTEPPGAQYLRPSASRSRNKETTPVNKRCAEVYQKVKSYFESYLQNLSEVGVAHWRAVSNPMSLFFAHDKMRNAKRSSYNFPCHSIHLDCLNNASTVLGGSCPCFKAFN